MPWCPHCKTEYFDDIEICPDCGQNLLESFDDEATTDSMDENVESYEIASDDSSNEEIQEDEPNSLEEYEEDSTETGIGEAPSESEYLESEYLASELDEALSESEERVSTLGGYSEIELTKAAETFINKPSDVYVKKADKYEDLKSTAVTFLSFGIIGLIFLALNVAGVFSIISGLLSIIVMAIVFVIFIIIGITSYSNSKAVKNQIVEEEDLTTQINNWLKENITANELDSIHQPSEADEVNFFKKIEYIKAKVSSIFPNLSDSYLDQLVEEFYNNNF